MQNWFSGMQNVISGIKLYLIDLIELIELLDYT